MSNNGGREAPPRAGAMIEALRGLGYSPEAALADIIDNSIAAGARDVRLGFFWDGLQSRISIADNGRGMDADGLFRAMRLGSRSPLEDRAPGDLGRFGMGLKTASFSQCRRLTVSSRVKGPAECLRWDLDIIAAGEGNSWRILDGPADGSGEFVALPDGYATGTLVLWENMDRLVGPGMGQQEFLDLIDKIEAHLAMVFHRFLEDRTLRLFINGNAVKPWDPFLSSNMATWRSPEDRLHGGGQTILAQAFVLPHRDHLGAALYDSAAGPHGWTAQQGFYVYRNRRMLVAGSWLGLGLGGRQWRREEQFRLARLRLDLPNTADAEWRIDIRKSTARPPSTLRQPLIDLANHARRRAREVFVFRNAPASRTDQAEISPLWTSSEKKSGPRYRIDKDHPAVQAVMQLAGPETKTVEAMLRIIEETIPVQRIWLDTAESRESPRQSFQGEPNSKVVEILATLFGSLVRRKGYSAEAAKALLAKTEPFHNYPELVADLSATPPTGE
jgi:hypothetical protein